MQITIARFDLLDGGILVIVVLWENLMVYVLLWKIILVLLL